MIKIKKDLFLKALKGEKVDRPPVWIMRQAGRYLPDFMKLKNKYDFFTRCQTPELACEITLMPIQQIGLDAAIIFSDILVVPQAMGVKVEMKNNRFSCFSALGFFGRKFLINVTSDPDRNFHERHTQ